MSSTTCGASAAPATSDARRDRTPQARQHRQRHAAAEARGLPRGRRARADDVARPVEAVLDRGDHRPRGVVGMQQRERRIARRADRHDRQAQQPPERARHVRADAPARSAARRPARRSAARRPSPIASTASNERPYGVRRRGHRVFVGNRARARSAVRRPRARCAARRTRARRCRGRVQRRDRAQLGALARRRRASCATRARTHRSARRRAARTPRRTRRAGRGRAGSMRRNSRAAQPAARRHEVDADDLGRPTSRCSISCATRVPSSPPIPVTSTRVFMPSPPRAAGAGTGSLRGSTSRPRAT